MTTEPREQTVPEPMHCDRPMMAVIDTKWDSPLCGLPIWWCCECAHRMPRKVTELSCIKCGSTDVRWFGPYMCGPCGIREAYQE